MPGTLNRQRSAHGQLRQALRSPGTREDLRWKSFLQQHPGAANLPMYQDLDVMDFISRKYEPGAPLGYGGQQRGFLGKIRVDDAPFLEQVLDIRKKSKKKKKKKAE